MLLQARISELAPFCWCSQIVGKPSPPEYYYIVLAFTNIKIGTIIGASSSLCCLPSRPQLCLLPTSTYLLIEAQQAPREASSSLFVEFTLPPPLLPTLLPTYLYIMIRLALLPPSLSPLHAAHKYSAFLPQLNAPLPSFPSSPQPSHRSRPRCNRPSCCHRSFGSFTADIAAPTLPQDNIDHHEGAKETEHGKLMAAMGLIIGTAVGPGILGLPAATLCAGLLPSTITIVACWVYVIASILLVAELTFHMMAEQNVEEVSFTSLAVHTLGHTAGRVVAVIYAMLNYALLVACIAGLGSIFQEWMPFLPSPLHSLLSPSLVAALVSFSSFKVIDGANQALCVIMLVSIACLLAMGTCFSQGSFLSTWKIGEWSAKALLPAIPVTVLTLGFHVITPVVCKVIGKPQETRRAILCAGLVPLVMVLSWNAVVLDLAKGRAASSVDPIRLLLSVSSFSGPAVQAFAFSALATTLIGYALSFPKQLLDTLALFRTSSSSGPKLMRKAIALSSVVGTSREQGTKALKNLTLERMQEVTRSSSVWVLLMALGPPALMSILHPGAFASALDFAGVYANCFLFGFLPPLMAWRHRYGATQRDAARRAEAESTAVAAAGGRFLLLSLIVISVSLGFGVPKS